MNNFAVTLLTVLAIGIMVLPRRWAPVPLLIGACYMTNAQSLNLGPFHFTVLRVLVLLGFIRAATRGEYLPGGLKGMDKMLIGWAILMVCSSVFHKPFGPSLVNRLGNTYNVLGIYFLIRKFCRTTDDMIQIIKILAFVLVPVSLEMINEKITHRNFFGFLGGVPMEVMIRDDKFRAQGPFGHPILAGTVGGLCIPFMIGIWRYARISSAIGVCACLGMVVASASSGPIMSVLISVFALMLWPWRRFVPKMRIAAVVFYIAADIVMTRPAYFLLERIDLTGSSTGYHRAAIIEAGVIHLREWIIGGTDYTRHWMPYGVSWSEDHCDITNHYLFYGVDGGLLVMLLFIAIVAVGFRYIHQSLKVCVNAPVREQFLIWAVGANLFAHAATMISVAYFDQSVMFLYLNLAVIGSLHATTMAQNPNAPDPKPAEPPSLRRPLVTPVRGTPRTSPV